MLAFVMELFADSLRLSISNTASVELRVWFPSWKISIVFALRQLLVLTASIERVRHDSLLKYGGGVMEIMLLLPVLWRRNSMNRHRIVSPLISTARVQNEDNSTYGEPQRVHIYQI